MTKTVSQTLYKVECAPECGFLIRNHNETELVSIVIAHCLGSHNKTVSAPDVKGMIQRA